MTQTVVALVVLITVALLTAMSLWANRRFKTEPRLPMQWLLDGSVTWTAPRRIALAFMPVLTAVSLAPTLFLKARAGQEHLVIPIMIFVGLAFLGVHAFHLWLMQRSLQGQRLFPRL